MSDSRIPQLSCRETNVPQYFDREQEKATEGLPAKCQEADASLDEAASGTLVVTVAADIRAPSFDSFPWDPSSDLAEPFILGTQDLFADPFPEFTLPSHSDLTFPQLLPTEDVLPIEEESSGNSSPPLAETFALGLISIEPSEGLQQDAQDKGATTGFEFDGPDQRVPTRKVTAPSLPKTSPNCKSCQICNKQFSRKHELQYVPQSI